MRLTVAVAVSCFIFASVASAERAVAAIRKPTSIPEQSLSDALQALARHREIQVLFRTETVGDRRTPGAHGELTLEETLTRMLTGSGLSYRFVDDKTVTIVPAAALSQSGHASIPTGVPIPVTRDRLHLAQADTRESDEADSTTSESPRGASATARIDEVVITGTSIRGLTPESSPVEIYTAEDIKRSGATTTEKFIATLPQNLGTFSQYAPGSSMNATNLDGVTSVDLRGLGVGTTLTLLNGKRMALSNGGRSADVSVIPANAIERVEVLTDGASAIYGSDAIGGVVNFVLRDDFEGAETRLAYGGVTSGGLSQLDASQTFGRHWGSGRGLASYSYRSASPLRTTDRDYAAGVGPGNLTPDSKHQSIFITLSQDVGERLSADLDLGVSRRDVINGFSNYSSPTPDFRTFADYRGRTQEHFVNAALNYQIGESVNAQLSAAYSKAKNESEVQLIRINLVPPFATAADFGSDHSQRDVMAKLEGALFALPGGQLRYAVGGGVLQEDYKGVSPTSNQQSAGTMGRRSPYAFAELNLPLIGAIQQIPLVHRLAVNVAARYTDYEDHSRPALDQDFGDSVDPKIGVLWAPVESLNLRATYGTSFRAPFLTQLDASAGYHYLQSIPIAGTPSTMLSMGAYAIDSLAPETATTFTVGFDYRNPAWPAFRVSGTYYNIDYSDRIGTAPSGGLNPFENPSRLPDLIYRPTSAAFIEEVLSATPLYLNLSDVVVTDPATTAALMHARGDVWIFDNRLRNLAISRQDGFDLTVDQSVRRNWGEIRLGATLTHILDYEQQGSAAAEVLPAFDIPGNPVDWRANARVGFSLGAFDGTVTVNYIDRYANPAATTGNGIIGSWTTVNLTLGYDFNRRAAGATSGPALTLSIENLFDSDPPPLQPGGRSNIIFPIGFDPANANPLGRVVTLGAVQKW